MRKELIVKTKSLAGSSDLTLLAPIKPGLVPSLESVTYKTRVKRLLQTLNTGRASSHEFALLRPFSDAVERVGKIHSVRVAVLEPEDKVLLAVTFEGGWESYIRVLWQKVGTLLDVIFCNTVDYVSAHDHSYEEWAEWGRRVQVETAFFYGIPGLTVDDVQYLRRTEVMHRQAAGPDVELEAESLQVQRVEDIAWNAAIDKDEFTMEAMRQGLQGLAVLYRLTELYPPDQNDGKYLRRAARDLLLEFVRLWDDGDLDSFDAKLRERFTRQLDWLDAKDPDPVRQMPSLVQPAHERDQVQGGILRAYEGVTHGCLVLMALDSREAAVALLGELHKQVWQDGHDHVLAPNAVAVNVAFTSEGLRAAGLTEEQLGLFPQEFREGMEARAGVLGDLRTNHPRRWRLPLRNWPEALGEAQHIELSSVHLLVQLRTNSSRNDPRDLEDPDYPLRNQIGQWASVHKGARVLAVEPMRRYLRNNRIVEHFGFADGDGQPLIDPAKKGRFYPNVVQVGEFIWGHANQADEVTDVDALSDPARRAAARERMALLRNGSFLVVRKLPQDVAALEDAVARASTASLPRERILAKMMGRQLNGTPLATRRDPEKLNDFNYEDDADQSGAGCPFHAHVRRVNPRREPARNEPPGGRMPRIMRRSMSYGPPYDHEHLTNPHNSKDRGLLFMAYNASIAEQFEVLQRWIAGGNSTAGYSGQSDPFLGVAENGQRRFFRFRESDEVVRVALDGANTLGSKPRPFVRLEWGAYLFAPSLPLLERLGRKARPASTTSAVPWSAKAGAQHMAALTVASKAPGLDAAAAWKGLLEDPIAQDQFATASVWAAIREQHGGVLKTPYGVLVVDRAMVMDAFLDPHRRYTVSGYHGRMEDSIGPNYLGLDRRDDDKTYEQESALTNQAIMSVSEELAFDRARTHAADALSAFIADASKLATLADPKRWELNLDVREVSDRALARLCEEWFALEETDTIAPGTARADWNPARHKSLYPGNFTAPSRYIFQPHPGEAAQRQGQRYGSKLREAFLGFVKKLRDADPLLQQPQRRDASIAKAIFEAFPQRDQDALVARTLVGALMGFLPTVDGNLRLSLNEWLRDGSFWSLRTALVACPPDKTPYQNAQRLLYEPLRRTMQLRPSPGMVWRTATRAHSIGTGPHELKVEKGEVVVLAIASATQQCLEDGDDAGLPLKGLDPVFGGHRSPVNPHPTHACPGYQAGLGVILGILMALLEAKPAMRPSPAPLAFTFEGPVIPAQP